MDISNLNCFGLNRMTAFSPLVEGITRYTNVNGLAENIKPCISVLNDLLLFTSRLDMV